ncbi:low-density lipoprotein receptor class A domain-containing protein 1 isoform X1 [Hyperolius riggenbachi]|uniref:low-density lipoprotein receptor class A domain-containing protein 1 isoform X1 n=1 Tax=Hyperolius riggenbachi TaxID=752182 RepID=UPI0035A294FA
MNRTFPKRRSLDAGSMGSTVTMLSREEKDLCCGCTRKCICVTAVILGILMVLAAIIACTVVLALPAKTPESRYCVTSNNYTGFLCDDRRTCLLPSQVCNGGSDCGNGEDETSTMCSNLPKNLPGYLVFYCANPQIWIYSNYKCNGINNCGDCSDESTTLASCTICSGSQWWPCTPLLYEYCYCIPRTLCQNGAQDCSDWSDEYQCTK